MKNILRLFNLLIITLKRIFILLIKVKYNLRILEILDYNNLYIGAILKRIINILLLIVGPNSRKYNIL